MEGVWGLVLGVLSMLSDLVRGRLPRDPYGVAVLVILGLAGGLALVMTLGPLVDGWLTRWIARAVP